VREDRIALINPGVDVQRYRPGLPCADLRASIGLSAGQKLILSVGRLSRRKGFDQTIRALPALLARGLDARYAIVGIGEDRDYLDGLARECGVAERVKLLGHVAQEDLPRWYNAADVVVMPNREIDGDVEGFGMVFIEAAACGKPAVAGRSGGTGSAVVDGQTGLLVDGASVDAIADALTRILSDADYARTLGETGHLRARREFSWEQVAERIRALERELALRSARHDVRTRGGR
jgi:phosphatidylinositol alpha-1,6-mannosyltransferase